MSKAVIKKVIEAYPYLGTKPSYVMVNCAYGLYSNDGKRTQVHASTSIFCHKMLRYAEPGFYDNLITSWPNDDVEFFDFLKNVLYRKWADHFHREVDEDTGKTYIRVSDLDKIPANVLQNFCISSRMPVEFPHHLDRMRELISWGLHPVMAFVLRQCQTDRKGPKGKVLQVFDIFNDHNPICLTSDLKRLVTCDPEKLSVPYKTEPKAVTPTVCIWGVSEDLRPLKGQTILEFWNNWKEKNADLLHVL